MIDPRRIAFDPALVPFSRFGSYLVISRRTAQPDRPAGLYLRCIAGDVRPSEVLKTELARHGIPLPTTEIATPGSLVMRSLDSGAQAEFCFSHPDVLRIRVQGASLRLCAVLPEGLYGHAIQVSPNSWEINPRLLHSRLRLTPLRGGQVDVDAQWLPSRGECSRVVVTFRSGDDSSDTPVEMAIERYDAVPVPHHHHTSFDDCCAASASDFAEFLKPFPAIAPSHAGAQARAAYVLWASTVGARGNFASPTVLMSKNDMSRLWTWDHCFNALALAHAHPQMAWDQFDVAFRHQHESGMLPDSISDSFVVWNYTKPPIHGWALERLLNGGLIINREHLRAAYAATVRWTNWWFQHRDFDGQGIPLVAHGNDTADNATIYDARGPVRSPDLVAYLIQQMDALARLATRLGRPKDAVRWSAEADLLLRRWLILCWDDASGRFRAPRYPDGIVAEGDCLMNFFPIMLGRRLPSAVADRLVTGLLMPGRFLTEHGLATEAVNSSRHEADGYWRGPIWAPPTLFIAAGLRDLGHIADADRIERSFCELCGRGGFAETFNAQTGEPQRDRAYSWTAAIFMMLAPIHFNVTGKSQ